MKEIKDVFTALSKIDPVLLECDVIEWYLDTIDRHFINYVAMEIEE
jgi:hypothetical protein